MGMGCVAKGIAYSLVTIVAGCASVNHNSTTETESQRLQRWTDAIEQNERQQEYWPGFKRVEYCADLKSYERKYNTIAHDVLGAESEFGTVPADYKFIDDLIDQAKEKIKTKKDYTRDEAINILSEIDLLLRKNDFSFEETRFLNQGIKKKKIDCDTSTFIYLAISESLNLPLYSVSTFMHVFARWQFDDTSYINWETNVSESKTGRFNSERTDAYYLDQLKEKGVSKEQADKWQWMVSLNRKQSLAEHYLSIGWSCEENKNFEKAIEYYTKSIELNPNEQFYEQRSKVFLKIDNLEKALEDCNKLIELDPKNSKYISKRDSLVNEIKYQKAQLEYENKLAELQRKRAENERKWAEDKADEAEEIAESARKNAHDLEIIINKEPETSQPKEVKNKDYSSFIYFGFGLAAVCALILVLIPKEEDEKKPENKSENRS